MSNVVHHTSLFQYFFSINGPTLLILVYLYLISLALLSMLICYTICVHTYYTRLRRYHPHHLAHHHIHLQAARLQILVLHLVRIAKVYIPAELISQATTWLCIAKYSSLGSSMLRRSSRQGARGWHKKGGARQHILQSDLCLWSNKPWFFTFTKNCKLTFDRILVYFL